MSENSCIRFSAGKRFGDWNVVSKIDEGGFGQVYTVQNKKTKEKAALKAEPNEVEGGSAIKLELKVLRDLNLDGEKPHVPVVFHAAKHRQYCYMIMTLLGENFKALKAAQKTELLSLGTWARLGIQCLYALKLVHDCGYIHRDIKPNNFVMGHPADPEKARIVFILDFGLARSYAFKSKSGAWIARLARGSAEFRGTVRYCSENVHYRIEQGRRDDLISLFYVLIELHCGLPWQTVREKDRIEKIKCNIADDVLMLNMPRELKPLISYLKSIDLYARPDYLKIYKAFISCLKRYNVGLDDPYDWEKSGSYKILKPSKKPAWQDAEAFFKSDPINVHGPPDKALSREETKQFTFEQPSRTTDN